MITSSGMVVDDTAVSAAQAAQAGREQLIAALPPCAAPLFHSTLFVAKTAPGQPVPCVMHTAAAITADSSSMASSSIG